MEHIFPLYSFFVCLFVICSQHFTTVFQYRNKTLNIQLHFHPPVTGLTVSDMADAAADRWEAAGR